MNAVRCPFCVSKIRIVLQTRSVCRDEFLCDLRQRWTELYMSVGSVVCLLGGSSVNLVQLAGLLLY